MKKAIRLAVCILILAILISSSALSEVYAIPNQKLALRTGPGTRFTELGSLPKSTEIYPIECEYTHNVPWVMFEVYIDGKLCNAYTGLKRMDVYGYLPDAYHDNIAAIVNREVKVYSSMYTRDTSVRGRLNRNQIVNILRIEDDLAYIEFYDSSKRAPSRGWVNPNVLELTDEYTGAFVSKAADVYALGNLDKRVGRVKKGEVIGILGGGDDYYEIIFYDSDKRRVSTGIIYCKNIEFIS